MKDLILIISGIAIAGIVGLCGAFNLYMPLGFFGSAFVYVAWELHESGFKAH